jgi:hypothetical protein
VDENTEAIERNTAAIGRHEKGIDENTEGVALALAMTGGLNLPNSNVFAVSGGWGKGFTIVDHLDPESNRLREKLPEIVARIEAGDFLGC